MDHRQIAKQMVFFNKVAFENSFNAMIPVYDQREKLAETVLSQATWMPAAGKKAIQDWISTYRAGWYDQKKGGG